MKRSKRLLNHTSKAEILWLNQAKVNNFSIPEENALVRWITYLTKVRHPIHLIQPVKVYWRCPAVRATTINKKGSCIDR